MRFSLLIILALFCVCHGSAKLYTVRSKDSLNGTNFNRFKRELKDQCSLKIVYQSKRYSLKPPGVLMKFQTEKKENRNYEELSGTGVEFGKEKLSGGLLKSIKIEARGEFCLKQLEFVCGQGTNELNDTERSIVLDALTIKKANDNLYINPTDNCIWMTSYKKFESKIGAINVKSTAFTMCGNNDKECLKEHIDVEIATNIK